MVPSAAPPHQVSDFRPRSFRERGAVVAFTTPMLGGARIRFGARGQLELIVCNPSGGRGVYILALSAIDAFSQPSLFDRALIAAIRTGLVLTPAGLRKAARETMAGGLAGRSAQRSASQATLRAEARQRETRSALRQLLLSQLMERDDPGSIAALAARLGLPSALLDAAILALADLFTDVGMTVKGRSPVAAQRARLSAFATQVDGAIPWLEGRHARAVLELRASLVQFAVCAKTLDADLGQLLADLPATMGQFIRDPIAIAEQVTRVDWLFDGWDRVATLWQDGVVRGPLPSQATLAEILPQIPPLPDEALTLIGAPPTASRVACPSGAAIDTDAGQRTIVSLDTMLARNERVITALA